MHPCFKFQWIKDDYIESLAKGYLKNLIDSCPGKSTESERKRKRVSELSTELIFDFPTASTIEDENEEMNGTHMEECGINKFLQDSSSITAFKKYPCLRRYFIQYNVGLPSSAAVERTFSIAGDVLRNKRTRLSDEHFEACVVLKCGVK